MTLESEYTVKIKMGDIVCSSSATDEQIREQIKRLGKERINAYLRGYSFDPEHKVFFEEISYKEKQYD